MFKQVWSMSMNRTDINNVLESLQTDIEKIEDTSTQKSSVQREGLPRGMFIYIQSMS